MSADRPKPGPPDGEWCDPCYLRSVVARVLAVCVLAVFWAYRVPLTAPTLILDDLHFLAKDRRIVEPALRPHLWTTELGVWDPVDRPGVSRFGGAFYRPLALASIAWGRDLWGEDPRPQRLVNLLFLLGLAVGVAVVVVRSGEGGQPLPALAAGALVASHPLGAELVGLFSNRFDLLAIVGVSLALAAATGTGPRALAGIALGFALAAGSKEIALPLGAAVPVVAALAAPRGDRLRRGLSALAAVSLVGILALVARAAVLGSVLPGSARALVPAPDVALGSAFLCLRHVLGPYDLQLLSYSPSEWKVVSALPVGITVVLAAFTVLGLVRGRARIPPHLLVAAASLLVIPILPLLEPRLLPFPYSDRYLAGPLVGVAMLLGLALRHGFEDVRIQGAASVLVLCLASGNLLVLQQRNAAFATGDEFLRVLMTQRYVAPQFLDLLRDAQHLREAELASGSGRASPAGGMPERLAAARDLAQRGEFAAALATLGEIDDRAPGAGDARLFEAYLWRRQHRLEEAERVLRGLLADPAPAPRARLALGEVLLARAGRPGPGMAADREAAMEELRRGLAEAATLPGALRPTDEAGARFNLGVALASTGRDREALAEIEAALALEPGTVRFRGARAELLERLGRGPEAAAERERVAAALAAASRLQAPSQERSVGSQAQSSSSEK